MPTRSKWMEQLPMFWIWTSSDSIPCNASSRILLVSTMNISNACLISSSIKAVRFLRRQVLPEADDYLPGVDAILRVNDLTDGKHNGPYLKILF